MRKVDDAVPGTFIQLDEDNTAADRFVNVRTQWVLRRNHNALCGQGHMRPIFADRPALILFSEGWAGVATPHLMACIYSVDVYLGQFVKKVKLRYRAKVTNATDMVVYASLNTRGLSNRTTQTQTINSTSYAWYTMDLTVPALQRWDGGRQACTFNMWTTITEMGGDVLGAPVNLQATTAISVSVLTASAGAVGAGDIIYFPSNSAIVPKVIQGYDTVGANRRFWISDNIPWTINLPEALTPDTMNAKHGNVLTVSDVQMYEYSRTDAFSTMEIDL